jgi:hypothetical protein
MALVGAIVTAIWLVLLIYGVATQGPVETSEQALASVADLDLLHYLTYANATLITITATLLFAGLYVYCRPQEAVWSAMGLAFVPAYTVLNLFAYLSQITIGERAEQPGLRHPGHPLAHLWFAFVPARPEDAAAGWFVGLEWCGFPRWHGGHCPPE